jgi:hypothetical protein
MKSLYVSFSIYILLYMLLVLVYFLMFRNNYIVAWRLKARISESERRPLLGNGSVSTVPRRYLGDNETCSRDNANITDVTTEMKTRPRAVPAITNPLATGASST